MSDVRKPLPARGDSASDRALTRLFAYARPREAPPASDAEEIRATLYSEWDSLTTRRTRWRRLLFLAAAAVVAAAMVFFSADLRPAPTLPTVAYVERLQGSITGGDANDTRQQLRVGASLSQGTLLSTGSGQLALRLVSGGSLRLSPETRVTLAAGASIELAAGSFYFDSENATASEKLLVITPLGSVRDVGTQFFARLTSSTLEVAVRDGSVSLVRGAERIAAGVGEKLTVTAAGRVEREPVVTYGNDWAWTEGLAPRFDIDGRQLMDFLQWVAMQTGRTLAFADPQAERVAREAVLKGSIDLEPLSTLRAVMSLTDLRYTIQGGQILIAVN